MKTELLKPRELIEELRKINKYGRSAIAADLFEKMLARLPEQKSLQLNHCLAVAELLSRMAPPGSRDEWYTAGLLHEIFEMTLPFVDTNSPMIISGYLKKAGVNRRVIYSLQTFRSGEDPRNWTPLIAALNFADSHTDKAGIIRTTEECCMINRGGESCNACMYARYLLEQAGGGHIGDDAIRSLNKDLEKADRKQQTGMQVMIQPASAY